MHTTQWADFNRRGTLRTEKRVVLGVPNAGRLLEEVALLIGPLVGLTKHSRELLFESDDLVVVCARSSDLPYLAAHGLADLVLTGYDYVVEAGVDLEQLHDTGFQHCVIGMLARPGNEDWRSRTRIAVATQYPGIARRHLDQPGMPDYDLLTISGAAELYARADLADVILDAYMTGETAAANGLILVDRLFETSGRLFARPGWRDEHKNITSVLDTLGVPARVGR